MKNTKTEMAEIGIGSIEAGKFVEMLDAEIRSTCRRFVAQVAADGITKAKAHIAAKIEVCLDDGVYTVIAEVGSKLPWRPVGGTQAKVGASGKDKQLTLFAVEVEAPAEEEAA